MHPHGHRLWAVLGIRAGRGVCYRGFGPMVPQKRYATLGIRSSSADFKDPWLNHVIRTGAAEEYFAFQHAVGARTLRI